MDRWRVGVEQDGTWWNGYVETLPGAVRHGRTFGDEGDVSKVVAQLEFEADRGLDRFERRP